MIYKHPIRKIPLTIASNFISSKDTDGERIMHSKHDNKVDSPDKIKKKKATINPKMMMIAVFDTQQQFDKSEIN